MNFERYAGSKGGSGVWQRIISEMPPHSTYVELFVGSGKILRTKRAAADTIGVDVDREVIDRLRGEVPAGDFICGDVLEWLKGPGRRKWCRSTVGGNGVVVYADPPYLLETRSCKERVYRHEFSDWQHAELLRALRALPCPVLLSGYRSSLYDTILADWRRVDIPTIKRNGQRATECLWCNFPPPVLLHDYRFVGGNRRERYRIKKKCRRWQAKVRNMPAWERAVIFNALSELASAGTVSWPAVTPGMVSLEA